MAPESPPGRLPEPARRHWAIPHIAAIALAIAVYFALYSVTGDSDLFIALATGAAGGYFTWVVIEVEFWFRRRRHGSAGPD
jgi:nitrate/nitrite transporter NarK